jgi:putative oxidoreductase
MASPNKYSHGAARVLMSTLFLVSGVGKLGGVKETQKYMEAYGVPGYLLYPAAALEIGGGLMLLSGFHTRWLSLVLSGWCLLTAAIFHTDLQDQNQKINLMKNMAMAGGFLVLADMGGPGHKELGAVYRWLKAKFWDRDSGSIQLVENSDQFLETADLLEKSGLKEELPYAFDADRIQRQYVMSHNIS